MKKTGAALLCCLLLVFSAYGGESGALHKMEEMFGGDPDIYPYEMIDYLSGNCVSCG